jgi:hypothetical protein
MQSVESVKGFEIDEAGGRDLHTEGLNARSKSWGDSRTRR